MFWSRNDKNKQKTIRKDATGRLENTLFFLFSLHAKIENLLQVFHVYDISGIWQVLRGIIQIVEKELHIGLQKKSF